MVKTFIKIILDQDRINRAWLSNCFLHTGSVQYVIEYCTLSTMWCTVVSSVSIGKYTANCTMTAEGQTMKSVCVVRDRDRDPQGRTMPGFYSVLLCFLASRKRTGKVRTIGCQCQRHHLVVVSAGLVRSNGSREDGTNVINVDAIAKSENSKF